MGKQEIAVWYHFTSTQAYGEAYSIGRTIKARNPQEALRIASLDAFSEFGARWNDNGIDITLSEALP